MLQADAALPVLVQGVFTSRPDLYSARALPLCSLRVSDFSACKVFTNLCRRFVATGMLRHSTEEFYIICCPAFVDDMVQITM